MAGKGGGADPTGCDELEEPISSQGFSRYDVGNQGQPAEAGDEGMVAAKRFVQQGGVGSHEKDASGPTG